MRGRRDTLSSNSDGLVLTDQDINDIQLFYQIARANGSHLSLSAAVSLLRSEVSEEEVALALSSSIDLRNLFQVQNGLIFARDATGDGFGIDPLELEKR